MCQIVANGLGQLANIQQDIYFLAYSDTLKLCLIIFLLKGLETTAKCPPYL